MEEPIGLSVPARFSSEGDHQVFDSPVPALSLPRFV